MQQSDSLLKDLVDDMKTRQFGEGESGAQEYISTVKVRMNDLLVEWSEQFENVCEKRVANALAHQKYELDEKAKVVHDTRMGEIGRASCRERV